MTSSVGDSFGVREFAALAGITVKALRHYDRIGLLTPSRSAAGYRRYARVDLARVEQIAALRLVGLTLREIGRVLDGEVAPLQSILTRQREALERKSAILDRALRALTSGPEPAAALDEVIAAIGVPDLEVMRRYFSDEAWAASKTHFEDWPPPAWRELFLDVSRARGEDPAGDVARSLADRWIAVSRAMPLPPGVREGLRRAWLDRENWPDVLKRRLARFDVERGARFIADALWTKWEAEREASERRGSAPPRVSQAKRDLFHDWAAILAEDPAGEKAQALAARWRAQIDWEAGGDEETKARILREFESRRRWPAGLKRYHATLFETDLETWQRVTDFIERAAAPACRA